MPSFGWAAAKATPEPSTSAVIGASARTEWPNLAKPTTAESPQLPSLLDVEEEAYPTVPPVCFLKLGRNRSQRDSLKSQAEQMRLNRFVSIEVETVERGL
jgi:hypothetical protein